MTTGSQRRADVEDQGEVSARGDWARRGSSVDLVILSYLGSFLSSKFGKKKLVLPFGRIV